MDSLVSRRPLRERRREDSDKTHRRVWCTCFRSAAAIQRARDAGRSDASAGRRRRKERVSGAQPEPVILRVYPLWPGRHLRPRNGFVSSYLIDSYLAMSYKGLRWICSQFEGANNLFQVFRLVLQGLGCSCRLLHQGRVLLGDLVHLGN